MFVQIGGTLWNLNAIAKLTPVSDPQIAAAGWVEWVYGVVTLVSGKEFGLSEPDFVALTKAVKDF